MVLQIGEQVGEYRLLRELGSGTFGTVYQAEHVLLGTQVAIKVLHGPMTEAERLELRAEARRLAALEHPYIVPVLTYAEQPAPYLVMKFAPNGTPAQRYRIGQRQPLATILPHVCQIAEGLQHAHDQQTLHLDLKPANVLLGNRQEALISDFGISVILQTHKTHQTVGHIAGTPAYMAPEQLQQKPGKASGQYSLATMVYQWLTGTLPFTGDVWSLGVQKLTQDPAPLRQYAPDLPTAVEQMVLRALSKDPKARYESAQEFATALAAVSSPHPPIGTLLATVQGHTGWIRRVAWSPDGSRLASASRDGILQMWEAASGRLLVTYQGHTDEAQSVAWSPDGTRLASASKDHTVRLWEATDGRLLFTYQGHTDPVFAASWSPDGNRLASCSGGLSWLQRSDNTVRVWEAANGRQIFICQGHTQEVQSVAWSPDGGRLASASHDGTVRIWETASGRLLFTCRGHDAWVNSAAWAPDSRRIASGSDDGAVCIWEAASGALLVTCQGHADVVSDVAWSSDGSRIASASTDNTVRVWEAATGRCLFVYPGHQGAVEAVAWSPDSSRIASGGADETVQVWSAG